MTKEEILAELESLVKERDKLHQAQSEIVELTRHNREMYEIMKEDIKNSPEPFTKLREYELEKYWDEVRQNQNELYREIEIYRLVINTRRDELIEQLRI